MNIFVWMYKNWILKNVRWFKKVSEFLKSQWIWKKLIYWHFKKCLWIEKKNKEKRKLKEKGEN